MLDVDCYCTLARRAALALTEAYDAALAPSGLKVTQFSLLRAIARLDDPSLTALARATGLDRSTLGRNMRVLGRDGLVTVVPGTDSRNRVARLTPMARAALAIALPLWGAAQARVAAAMPDNTQTHLRSLTRVVAN